MPLIFNTVVPPLMALTSNLSGPFYLAQVRMTWSPRSHFDYLFALYYVIYIYELIIIG